MAFLFVDQITQIEAGRFARGRFTIPPGIDGLPPTLIAEAVGQLAAWAAMARFDFHRRPVAAAAGEIRVQGEAHEGDVIELTAEVRRCDAHAVLYGGHATVGNNTLVRMRQCVGPLLRAEEFDDPAAVRARFVGLQENSGRDANPDGIDAPRPAFVVLEAKQGVFRTATLDVPEQADFFRDHFPRKPVFPATLLIDAMGRLAVDLAGDVLVPPAGVPLHAICLRRVKVRAFSPPGRRITVETSLLTHGRESAHIAVTAGHGSRPIAHARVEVGWWPGHSA